MPTWSRMEVLPYQHGTCGRDGGVVVAPDAYSAGEATTEVFCGRDAPGWRSQVAVTTTGGGISNAPR